jgi:hypothetical protein
LRMGNVHLVVPFKNLLTGCLRGVAVVVLVIYGEINWGYGVPMAVGGLIGGYLGGTLTGKINPSVLRAVVMTIGFGLAAYYFWTLYGPSKLPFGGEYADRRFSRARRASGEMPTQGGTAVGLEPAPLRGPKRCLRPSYAATLTCRHRGPFSMPRA